MRTAALLAALSTTLLAACLAANDLNVHVFAMVHNSKASMGLPTNSSRCKPNPT